MATRKVTVTLPEEQLEQIRVLVEARRASSVSGSVQQAVGVAIHDVVSTGAVAGEVQSPTM